MRWRGATKFIIILVVAVSVVYDVVAYLRGGVHSTISRVTLAWASGHPVVPFGVGVLCGHLFWAQPEPKKVT
jgi:hypothetical protein